MRKHLGIAVFFIFLISIITFPLVFKISIYLPGFFSTDEPFGIMWSSWRIKYSFFHNLSLKSTSLIAYPFGIELYDSGYASYLWIVWFHTLSLFTTPLFTWNIQILINIFLSLVFSYFLIFYLTGIRLAGLLGGIIFGLCPYQFMRIWQHLGLTYNQWLPFCLLSAILLKEKEERKYAWLFLVSLLLLLSFDLSVMYLGTTALSLFFIYIILYHWRIKYYRDKSRFIKDVQYIKKVFLLGLIVFFVLLPQFLPVIRNRLELSSTTKASAFNLYHRPFEDLFTQSAKPLGYLLPATVHPIFGKFTEQFIGSPFYGQSFTEHTLYLGWVPLILALVATRRWRKNKTLRIAGHKSQFDEKDSFYISFFVFLAIMAWLFSQPPWWNIFGFKIYMPSFFMYKLLPMFRAYCRFGIVVMLAVAILAGFGLKFILERFKSNKTKIAITALVSGLILFEFWSWPPYKVIDVSEVPAVYYWLKNQPQDIIIAEYPLDANSPNEMYKFYQITHERRMVNGTIPGTPANTFSQLITKLSKPRTASLLRGMGVKYVLVHHDGYLQTDLLDDRAELEQISQNSGLRLVRSFPAEECLDKDIICLRKTGVIDVYEIVAEPISQDTLSRNR